MLNMSTFVTITSKMTFKIILYDTQFKKIKLFYI